MYTAKMGKNTDGSLRWLVWCVFVGSIVAASLGCGDKSSPAPKGGWPRAADTVITYSFSFNSKDSLQSRSSARTEAASSLAVGLQEIVSARLAGFGCGTYVVTVKESGELVVLVPTSMAGREAVIEDLLTRPGILSLRIEVRPEEEIQGASGGQSKASPLWPHDFPAFLDFKRDEVDRWRRALAAGENYEPSRVGFRLVLRAGAKGTGSQHFGVVRESDPHLALDESMFENPRVVAGSYRRTYITLDIRDEHRSALGGLTGQNIGRRMAVILDGKLETAPVIQSRLSETIQFALHNATPAEDLRRAQVLVGVLSGGALPVPLVLESIE